MDPTALVPFAVAGLTKDNDSWSKICNSMKINYNQRKLFYDWLSKVHGFGIISPDDSDRFEFEQGEKPPWMKFYDPYSTFHPAEENGPHTSPYLSFYGRLYGGNMCNVKT